MVFIAVHAGAGFHSPSRDHSFKMACENACVIAMQMLKDGKSALDACVEAIKELENNPITNAGVGSALNRDGYVECDAALMESQSKRFGAVGALQSWI